MERKGRKQSETFCKKTIYGYLYCSLVYSNPIRQNFHFYPFRKLPNLLYVTIKNFLPTAASTFQGIPLKEYNDFPKTQRLDYC